MSGLEARLAELLQASPRVMTVLSAMRDLELPQAQLVSGAVYQTAFNALTGRAPDYGIKDYDVFYFDPDPSWEAEDRVIRRLAAALPPDLAPQAEARNQARVHLWYPQKFGRPYPPVVSVEDSLSRALCTAHAVGAWLDGAARVRICAPFGLSDLFDLVLRPAPHANNPAEHVRKAQSVLARWPEVRAVEAADRNPS